jgi:hypothetical protein
MGQKYISYDAEGNILAYYDSVDSPVPAGTNNVIPLTLAQWQACITTPGYTAPAGVLTPPADPTDAELLGEAQLAQILEIYNVYNEVIQNSVQYTTEGGVAQTFQADTRSQNILVQATQGYTLSGSVPQGFYWVAEDNTLVPFTLNDLKNLYQLTLLQGWDCFQKLQQYKAAIYTATTVADVQAVVWQ